MPLSRYRVVFLVSGTLSIAGCSIDALLEDDAKPKPVAVSLALESNALGMAPGASAALVATATRLNDSQGKLTFSLTLPEGFDGDVTNVVEAGILTTATITIHASASVDPAAYGASVRVTGEPSGGSLALLTLNVALLPAITVVPAQGSVTIIPGGIAPLGVSVTRTNVTDPVTLALLAPAGITLALPNEPVTGSTTSVTLTVGAGVAPGNYAVTMRGSAPGVPDHDASLSVVVSPDGLQLILDDVSAVQATLVSADVIVNRNGVAGAVTLSAEGLPAGVDFSADPVAGAVASVELVVTAGAAPGSYPVTLRGSDGSQSATTTFQLTVAPSNVGITLVPPQVAVLPGSGAVSVLTMVRTSFNGSVSLGFTDVPVGMTVETSEAILSGNTATVMVAAASDVTPGVYQVTVRASPLPASGGGPALDPVTAPLTITVVAPPPGGGNVILDWTRCTAPSWVAGQDGTGPWVQLAGAQGLFGMSVVSARGGIAYSTGARSLAVRFATNAELTTAPVDMCPPGGPAVATQTITGDALFTTIATSASYSWNLGGGVGLSTLNSPAFTIAGVRPGIHDLVGTGTIGGGRGPIVIMRDVDQSLGTYIGQVPVIGEFSITSISTFVRVLPLASERLTAREIYLTTAACTPAEILQTGLSTPGSGSAFLGVSGIPTLRQRANDMHLIEVTAVSAIGTRFATLSVHTLTSSVTPDVTLPAQLPTYSVTQPAGSHQRLQFTMAAMPTGYSSDLTFSFDDGQASVAIVYSSASLATFMSGALVLEMPELGGIGGFPTSAVPPAGSHGNWSISLAGSNGRGTDCSDGASRWSILRTGAY